MLELQMQGEIERQFAAGGGYNRIHVGLAQIAFVDLEPGKFGQSPHQIVDRAGGNHLGLIIKVIETLDQNMGDGQFGRFPARRGDRFQIDEGLAVVRGEFRLEGCNPDALGHRAVEIVEQRSAGGRKTEGRRVAPSFQYPVGTIEKR